MKKFSKLLIIMGIGFSLTGCVKVENEMTINKDKSMIYQTRMLLKEEFFEGAEQTKNDYNEEDLKKKNIEVKEIADNGYKGMELSKKYPNIDKISSKEGKTVQISDFGNEEFDDSVLFKIEKGLLKNKYTATFKYDTSEFDASNFQDEDNNENLNEDEDYEIEEQNDVMFQANETPGEEKPAMLFENEMVEANDNAEYNDTLNEDALDGLFGEDSLSAVGDMKLEFKVTLPVKALENNATSTQDDGKILIWDLAKEQNINYSFELLNMNNIYIGSAVVLIALIIVVIVILTIIKNKKNKVNNDNPGEPIYSGYDESIANEINNEQPTIIENQIDTLINQEQQLMRQPNFQENTNVEQPIQTIESTMIPDEVVENVDIKEPKFITPEMKKYIDGNQE